jgi:hypothetical protein
VQTASINNIIDAHVTSESASAPQTIFQDGSNIMFIKLA